MQPYLSFEDFLRRSDWVSRPDAIALESREPGWFARCIGNWSERINAQLRKRYGNAANVGNSLPLGRQPPKLLAAGTNPPEPWLTGTPTLGSLEVLAQITAAGALGAAVFRYSINGGRDWTAGVVTAALVPIPGTGMTLNFPVGAYGSDNVYSADTPVPGAVLGWLTILVSRSFFSKRGRNPSDSAMVDLQAEAVRVFAEIEQAANSKDGLFDLPVSEDLDSAVTTGGPLGYNDVSPYVWTDQQAVYGRQDDRRGRGM